MRTSSLTADLADAIRGQAVAAGAETPAVRGADWRTATVQTVNADGTVLTDDNITARRLQSYVSPAVDDVIVISQSSLGNWIAQGRLAATAVAPVQLSGAVTMGWTAASSATSAVVFSTAFAAAPRVFVNINSGSGNVARWVARAISVTTSGFTMFLFSADVSVTTASGIEAQWLAVAP